MSVELSSAFLWQSLKADLNFVYMWMGYVPFQLEGFTLLSSLEDQVHCFMPLQPFGIQFLNFLTNPLHPYFKLARTSLPFKFQGNDCFQFEVMNHQNYFGKVDVCEGPLFANLVTYITVAMISTISYKLLNPLGSIPFLLIARSKLNNGQTCRLFGQQMSGVQALYWVLA